MPKVFKPKLQVTLVKRIDRAKNGQSVRFSQAAGRTIDLSPFIGEGCEVSTDKNIRSPVGCFTITVFDKPETNVGGVLDSLYGLVEPMDYVEIRMARRPELYAGSQPPVIMRGFVRSIRRCETMGANGRPARKVIINGMDYGMIPQIYQMFLRADYVSFTNVSYVNELHLFNRTGLFAGVESSDVFMRSCLRIVNGWLTGMVGAAGFDSQVPSVIGSDFTVTAGKVSPFSMQPLDGNVWSLMQNWADLPWNELFFEDRADGPYLVYRPCPFTDKLGKSILGVPVPYSIDAAQPGGKVALVLKDSDVVSYDLARSDQDVANFYWVETQAAAPAGNEGYNIQSLANGSAIVKTNPNADPSLYGLRKMSGRSMQADGTFYSTLPVQTVEETQQATTSYFAWNNRRRQELINLNIDNVVWENGQLDLKGNEMVRPGTFLSVRRGQITSRYYVTSVRHMFAPLQQFKTMVSVERGDGFLKRVAIQGAGNQNLPVIENPRGVYKDGGE